MLESVAYTYIEPLDKLWNEKFDFVPKLCTIEVEKGAISLNKDQKEFVDTALQFEIAYMFSQFVSNLAY